MQTRDRLEQRVKHYEGLVGQASRELASMKKRNLTHTDSYRQLREQRRSWDRALQEAQEELNPPTPGGTVVGVRTLEMGAPSFGPKPPRRPN